MNPVVVSDDDVVYDPRVPRFEVKTVSSVLIYGVPVVEIVVGPALILETLCIRVGDYVLEEKAIGAISADAFLPGVMDIALGHYAGVGLDMNALVICARYLETLYDGIVTLYLEQDAGLSVHVQDDVSLTRFPVGNHVR